MKLNTNAPPAVADGLGKAAIAVGISAATMASTQAIKAPSNVKANPATSNFPGCTVLSCSKLYIYVSGTGDTQFVGGNAVYRFLKKVTINDIRVGKSYVYFVGYRSFSVWFYRSGIRDAMLPC